MASALQRVSLPRISALVAILLAVFVTSASTQTFSVKSRTDLTCGVGSGPVWVEVFDLNNDGTKDIFTANYNGNSVSVFLGNGSGGLLPRVDYATGIGAFTVRVADLNNDLKGDLLVANYAGGSVSVLLGNGDGTFQPAITTATGAGCAVAKAGYLNNDPYVDVVTANYNANTMSVLFGNGAGGFTSKTDYVTGTQPNWVAGADLDNDGDLEMITANYGGNSISYFLGNGDGTFAPKLDYPMGANPVTLTLNDFDNNNLFDVITANNGASTISRRLNQGSGSFGGKVDIAVSGNPITVTSGDLNLDGNIDVVTCNENTNNVSVLIGFGNGGFQTHVDYAVGTLPQGVTIADANGDGEPDIVTANQTTNDITILAGNVPGGFAVADTAAALVAKDQGNVSRTLASYLGKWVTLDICPQWCPPCNQMAHYTQQVYDTWTGHLPFEYVTAMVEGPVAGKGSDQSVAVNWATRYSITRPVLHESGSNHGTIRSFVDALRTQAYPTRVIIDPQGKVRAVAVGFLDAQEQVNELAALAGVSAPPVASAPPPPPPPGCTYVKPAFRAMQAVTIDVSYGNSTTSIPMTLQTGGYPDCANYTHSNFIGTALSCAGMVGAVYAQVTTETDSLTNSEKITIYIGADDPAYSPISVAQPWQVKLKNIAWPDGVPRGVAPSDNPTVSTFTYNPNNYGTFVNTTIDPATAVAGTQMSLTSFPLGNVPDLPPTTNGFYVEGNVLRRLTPLAVDDAGHSDRIELAAPRPNPASRVSMIRWSMPAAGSVRLTIVDVMGRQVRNLRQGLTAAGEQSQAWDLRDESGHRVAPGLYFAALTAGGVDRRARLVVLE